MHYDYMTTICDLHLDCAPLIYLREMNKIFSITIEINLSLGNAQFKLNLHFK